MSALPPTRRPPMAITLQRACLWSGPLFVAIFFGGILAAGWLPPVSANQSVAEVAAMYRADADRIRLGALLIGMASTFQGIWAALMSSQLRRIEGERPLLSYVQLGAGAVGILVAIIPAFLFAAAAFDPGRDPEVTKALHTLGWMCLVGIGWPAMLQALAVGAAALADRAPDPVFPRWFGWFNLWVAIGFLPGPFLVFFHTGPFAWHGAAVFWLPATVFGAWFAVWFWALRRAIDREERELVVTSPTTVRTPAPSPVRRDELEVV